jgi:hypothetical protein
MRSVVLSAKVVQETISATRFLFYRAKPTQVTFSLVKGGLVIKGQKSQKKSFVRCFSLFLITALLLVPFTVVADPLVFVRTVYEPDNVNIKKVKLSATLKMDKKGDMVIQCLNLFSIPVAHAPFADNPGIHKLAQRTRLQVEQKGRGVFIKLAILF